MGLTPIHEHPILEEAVDKIQMGPFKDKDDLIKFLKAKYLEQGSILIDVAMSYFTLDPRIVSRLFELEVEVMDQDRKRHHHILRNYIGRILPGTEEGKTMVVEPTLASQSLKI